MSFAHTPSRAGRNASQPSAWIAAICVALACGFQPEALAAEPAPETSAKAEAAPQGRESATPLSDSNKEALDAALRVLMRHERDAQKLAKRREASRGLDRRLVDERLSRTQSAVLDETLAFAAEVKAHAANGEDVSAYNGQVRRRLKTAPVTLRARERRLRNAVAFSPEVGKASDQIAADRPVKDAIEQRSQLYDLRLSQLELASYFGLDTRATKTRLEFEVAERTANSSLLLSLAMDDAAGVREQLELAPDDAEAKARAAVADARVDALTASLAHAVEQMSSLELETAEYDQQLVAATGAISTNVLDPEVLTGIVSGWGETVSSAVIEDGPGMAFQLGLFVVIVLVFFQLAQVAKRLVERSVQSSRVRLSELLKRMIISGTRNLIVLLGLLIALSQIGVSLGPVLAGLGIAGFIIGFALQDSLSNFASGLMILLYRPIDVGDLVEAGGVFGNVNHMSLVNTTILTLDNQTLIVPNNLIWTNVIKNVTAQGTRRIDLLFGISYGDDVAKAERVLTEIVESHPSVLKDPEPRVKLHELGDSSVNFVVRPWVRSDDYWDVYWDITRAVKIRFDEEDVSIPFPQRDVHFYPTAPPDAPSQGDSASAG